MMLLKRAPGNFGMSKPNILLLMTDQQRWDALGCYWDWLQTPNLDLIASEGLRFTNCVTNSLVCIPACLSMATGLYPHNTGVWNNVKHQMGCHVPTWMQAVRIVGYRTSSFGKTHLHPHQGDLRKCEDLMSVYGLDDVNEIGGPRASTRVLSHVTAEWKAKGVWLDYQDDSKDRFETKPHVVRPSALGLDDYADVYVGQQAKKYLENYQRSEPWFCWVSFGGPHEPWDTPEPYASLYDMEQMPASILRLQGGRDRPQGWLDLHLIDHQIGEVLQVIRDRGGFDNTIVVFVSDHGEMNGDYNLIYKSNYLNGATRVPLLLRTPETAKNGIGGQICTSPVEWFDVGPTLVELAGGEVNYQQFAKSLCNVLEKPMETHRDYAMSELSGEIMLLSREWKIALNTSGEVYLLFSVQADPSETENLAGLTEYKHVENQLRHCILDRLVQSQFQKK